MMQGMMRDACRFEYDSLVGYIGGGGNHGVHFVAGGQRRPVTHGACMNVEHYYSDDVAGGMFVPRKQAAVDVRRVGDERVCVDIPADDTWRVTTTVTYTLLPERTIAAEYAFAFEKPYAMFEAFLSNYFHDEAPPYLRIGEAWKQVEIAPLEHRYWMRSNEDAVRFAPSLKRREAELQTLVPDCDTPIDAETFDSPVMITPVGEDGWCVVHWFDAAECISLSANRRWQAHDFSFIGRDVAAGETVLCRGWMSYQKLKTFDAALDLRRQTPLE